MRNRPAARCADAGGASLVILIFSFACANCSTSSNVSQKVEKFCARSLTYPSFIVLVLNASHGTPPCEANNTSSSLAQEKGENQMKTDIITAAALLAATTAMSDMTAGWRESVSLHVPAETRETVSGRLTIGDGGSLEKIGGGELTLPQSQIDRSAPYAVDVLEGTLSIEAGAASPSAVSPARRPSGSTPRPATASRQPTTMGPSAFRAGATSARPIPPPAPIRPPSPPTSERGVRTM